MSSPKITIIDVNNKFYTYQKDLVLLEKIDAIREAINNVVLLNESDIPLNNTSGNIDYSSLKYMNHFEASELITRLETAILKIDYIKSVDIKFYYKLDNKKIELSVVLDGINEDVTFNLDLV